MIKITHLNRQQLTVWVESEAFKHLPDWPISLRRAASHVRNPRAEASDILLLLAWIDDELVGYLGVLPDRYYPVDKPATRCGWLSCLWVSDRHRGKSIAKLLVSEGVTQIGGQILLTEFTPQAKQLYDRLGFFSDLKISQGLRLYFRFASAHILPPKRPFFARIKPVLTIIDRLSNILVDVVTYPRRHAKTGINFCYVSSVDEETADFIHDHQGEEFFRRGQSEINWALTYPWVADGEPDEWSRKYYFSSVDRQVECRAIQIKDANGALCAFLVLSRRNGHLKMPVCYFKKEAITKVAAVVQHHVASWQISMFTTFHPEIVAYFRTNKTFALFKKTLNRHYLATKAMAGKLNGQPIHIQDGDGDCFFT
ncbi:MAG: GNAT family N-acetyltransferase [Saprospiraceae bacterium]|nr:GNAT family N-acetyltransferase [Saprospiraceae bacterium]